MGTVICIMGVFLYNYVKQGGTFTIRSASATYSFLITLFGGSRSVIFFIIKSNVS